MSSVGTTEPSSTSPLSNWLLDGRKSCGDVRLFALTCRLSSTPPALAWSIVARSASFCVYNSNANYLSGHAHSASDKLAASVQSLSSMTRGIGESQLSRRLLERSEQLLGHD